MHQGFSISAFLLFVTACGFSIFSNQGAAISFMSAGLSWLALAAIVGR